MNPSKVSLRRTSLLLASLLVGTGILGAADDATTTAVPANSGTSTTAGQQSQNDEIARLKQALAAQQKQLEALQQAIEKQQQAINRAVLSAPAPMSPASLGNVASLTPMVPAPAPVALALPSMQAPTTANSSSKNPCEAGPDAVTPAYLRLGSVCVVPIGFMDFTPFWRDKNAASSMGSNFGSVPFNNVANGNLSEFHFSEQNSRLGFRIDGDWKGAHFIGYNEFDFNGTSGSTSLAVSNGAIVPRLRLYWVDVRKNKLEFLAGQSWSLLTPNRKGLSALPGDLFYGQVIDINYIAGLTWTRQPGLRILYHPNDKVTFGLSAEQGDQYIGGSAGGSGITLPTAYAGVVPGQLDNAGNISTNGYLAQPTLAPDFIAKVAFDPSSRFHFEVGGLVSTFKIVNPAVLSQHSTTTGAGVLVGGNVELVKNFRLISTNYWSDGGGRYLFGQAPDVIVRADGSLSAVHAGGTIDGVEAAIKNTLLYAYYGGIYIGRDAAIDTNGSKIGYGYAGSPNSMNRVINEITFGFNQTIWKNPRYGAINFMGQYEYLMRDPWAVAANAPKNTHDNTIYMNIRYTLPGSMPNF
ncbi:MAG TPA: hypothetical protein VG273_12170 [Bryobacteraceae bacterium]|jgi:hypothetical protein|nr:hypothetical protein [Bryobacteraceae bacterium]